MGLCWNEPDVSNLYHIQPNPTLPNKQVSLLLTQHRLHSKVPSKVPTSTLTSQFSLIPSPSQDIYKSYILRLPPGSESRVRSDALVREQDHCHPVQRVSRNPQLYLPGESCSFAKLLSRITIVMLSHSNPCQVLPFILLSQLHQLPEVKAERGFGTDVALLVSATFLSQVSGVKGFCNNL